MFAYDRVGVDPRASPNASEFGNHSAFRVVEGVWSSEREDRP